MALNKDAVREAVQLTDGSDAFTNDALRRAQPVLRYLWENYVPWIVRKLVNFLGAIDDYLEEDSRTPPAYR